MVWTRATAPMDSNLNLDRSTGPGENTNNACSDMSRSTTRSPLLTTEARPDIQPIVEAIILAFTDQRLMEERLAPALGPALAPALHSCFMMERKRETIRSRNLRRTSRLPNPALRNSNNTPDGTALSFTESRKQPANALTN